jgi:chloramphenicol-sensitive protein RarD
MRAAALGWRRSVLKQAGPQTESRIETGALLAAIAAYSIWGFMPLFFKQLAGVPAIEIIAHRVLWAVPFLLIIMAFRKQLNEFWDAITSLATLRWMALSAILVSVNWLVYVWAVNNDYILAASLGYYFNPLLNVLIGTVFLKETLTRLQWIAVAIAVVAVAVLAAGALDTLWISLSLAVSFAIYGVVKKLAPVGAIPGLTIETTLLFPVAFAAAMYFGTSNAPRGWNSDMPTTVLLIAGGAITAIPLLLFATAARRMSYSVIGLIQYIGPTIQFLLGVFLYDEALSGPRLLSFLLIWVALAVFSWDGIRRMRSLRQSNPVVS